MSKTYRAMIFATILFLVAAFHQAHAQAFPCLPSGFPAFGAGTESVSVKSPAGKSDAWFCKVQRTDGSWWWDMQHYSRLTKYSVTGSELDAIFDRIRAAPDILAAVSDEVTKGAVIPAAGSADAFELQNLRYLGCVELVKPPLRIVTDKPPVCVAPGVPPVVYTHFVKLNGTSTTRPAYALTNGVRGTKEVARATVGQPCKAASGTADQWLIFGPAFAANVVALCARMPATP